jgi:hypothetical protein
MPTPSLPQLRHQRRAQSQPRARSSTVAAASKSQRPADDAVPRASTAEPRVTFADEYIALANVAPLIQRLLKVARRIETSASVIDDTAAAEKTLESLMLARSFQTRKVLATATFLEVAWRSLQSGSDTLSLNGSLRSAQADELAAVLGVLAHEERVHVIDCRGGIVTEDFGHLILYFLGGAPHVHKVLLDADDEQSITPAPSTTLPAIAPTSPVTAKPSHAENEAADEGAPLSPSTSRRVVRANARGDQISEGLRAALLEQCADNVIMWEAITARRNSKAARQARKHAASTLQGRIAELETQEHAARKDDVDAAEYAARRKLMALEHMNVAAAKRRMKRRIGLEVDFEARVDLECDEQRARKALLSQLLAAERLLVSGMEGCFRDMLTAEERGMFEKLLFARKASSTAARRETEARLRRLHDERVELGREEVEYRVSILQSESYFRQSLNADEAELRVFTEKIVSQRLERVHGEQRRKRAERDRLAKDVQLIRERERTEEAKRGNELARDKDRVQSRAFVVMTATERDQDKAFEHLRIVYAAMTGIAKLRDTHDVARKALARHAASLRPLVTISAKEACFHVQRFHDAHSLEWELQVTVPDNDRDVLQAKVDQVRLTHTAYVREIAKVRQALILDGPEELLSVLGAHGLNDYLVDHSTDTCPNVDRLVAGLCTVQSSTLMFNVQHPDDSPPFPEHLLQEELCWTTQLSDDGCSATSATTPKNGENAPAGWSVVPGHGDVLTPQSVDRSLAFRRDFTSAMGEQQRLDNIQEAMNGLTYSAAAMRDGISPHFVGDEGDVTPLRTVNFEPCYVRIVARLALVTSVVDPKTAVSAQGFLHDGDILTGRHEFAVSLGVPVVLLPAAIQPLARSSMSASTAAAAMSGCATESFGDDETVDVYREGSYMVRALNHIIVRDRAVWVVHTGAAAPLSPSAVLGKSVDGTASLLSSSSSKTETTTRASTKIRQFSIGDLAPPHVQHKGSATSDVHAMLPYALRRRRISASSASPLNSTQLTAVAFQPANTSQGYRAATVVVRIVNPVPDCDFLALWLEPNWVESKVVQRTATPQQPHTLRLVSGTIVQCPADVTCGSPILPFDISIVKLADRVVLRFVNGRDGIVTARDVQDTLRAVRFGTIKSPTTGYRRIETTVLDNAGLVSSSFTHIRVVGATEPTLHIARMLTERPFYSIAGTAVHQLAAILIQVDSEGIVPLLPGARLIEVGSSRAAPLLNQLAGAAGAVVSSATLNASTCSEHPLDDRNGTVPCAHALIVAHIDAADFDADDQLLIDESALPDKVGFDRFKTHLFLGADIKVKCTLTPKRIEIDLTTVLAPRTLVEALLRSLAFASSKRRSFGVDKFGDRRKVHVDITFGKLEAHDTLEVLIQPPHVEMPLPHQRRTVQEGRRECTFGPFIAAETPPGCIDCFNGGWARVAIVQGQGPEDMLGFRPCRTKDGFSLVRVKTLTEIKRVFTERNYDSAVNEEEPEGPRIPPPEPVAPSIEPQTSAVLNPFALPGVAPAAATGKAQKKPVLAKRVPLRWSGLERTLDVNGTSLMSLLSDRRGAPVTASTDVSGTQPEELMKALGEAEQVAVDPLIVFPGGAKGTDATPFNCAAQRRRHAPCLDRARGCVREFVRVDQEFTAREAATPNERVVETLYHVVNNATNAVIGNARVRPHEILVSFAPANDTDAPVTKAVAIQVLQRATYYCSPSNKAEVQKKFIRFSMRPFDGSSSQIVCVVDVKRDDCVPRMFTCFPKFEYNYAQYRAGVLGNCPVLAAGTAVVEDDTPAAMYDGGLLSVQLHSPFGDDQLAIMAKEDQVKAQVLGDVWRQEQRFLVAQSELVHPNICELLVRTSEEKELSAVTVETTTPNATQLRDHELTGADPTALFLALKFNDPAPPPTAVPAKKKKKDVNDTMLGTVEGSPVNFTVTFHSHATAKLRPEIVTALLNSIVLRARTTNYGRRTVTLRLRRGDSSKTGQCRIVIDITPPLLAIRDALSVVAPVKVPGGKVPGTPIRLLPAFDLSPTLPRTNRFTQGYVEARIDTTLGEPLKFEALTVDSTEGCKPNTDSAAPLSQNIRQFGRDVYVDGCYFGYLSVLTPAHIKVDFSWASGATPERVRLWLAALRYTWWGPQPDKVVRRIDVIVSEGKLPPAPVIVTLAVAIDGDGGHGVAPVLTVAPPSPRRRAQPRPPATDALVSQESQIADLNGLTQSEEFSLVMDRGNSLTPSTNSAT